MISAAEARIEQLTTELNAERALRIAAEEAQIEGEKRQSYWYRRCEFAEVALESCVTAYQQDPQNIEAQLVEAIQQAHTVLAERRKGEVPNLERYVRDRRQKKMRAWCLRAFAGVDDRRLHLKSERAKRFLEEAVELYQAVCTAGYHMQAYRDVAHKNAVKIVDRVMARPPGEVKQEIGQCAVTLGILAEQFGVSVAEQEDFEFARVQSVPNETWAARWQAKIDAGL